MSTNRSKDRASLCSFTFAAGRQCRMLRRDAHPTACRSQPANVIRRNKLHAPRKSFRMNSYERFLRKSDPKPLE